MAKDTLTITDNRTGEIYEVPISYGTYPEYGAAIPASELRKIKASENDFGLITYDPGYTNTGSCKSNITFVDGQRGLLRYRGYPIDQLAEKSNYLEISYLLLNGERPNQEELNDWTENITMRTMLNESIKKVIDAFHYDAHPMGILVSTLGVLSTFYPKAKEIFDEESRTRQIWRLIAKMPTIAAYAYRHQRGLPYVLPDNDLSYTGNFLNMLFKVTEQKYDPDPILERALDVLFILHADHEQNCSTSVMRGVGSSQSDPYVAVAGAAAALYGPLHGGANQRVKEMLDEIGSPGCVVDYVDKTLAAGKRVMGFGHRVYRVEDPRGRHLKAHAEKLQDEGDPMMLETSARLIEVMDQRKGLSINVDFYSASLYTYLRLPPDLFPNLFAISRIAGWSAHILEQYADNQLIRPRSEYRGPGKRRYRPLGER